LKVLIVDNKDSFTYNLKHYIHTFCDYVDVIRYSEIELENLATYDKILISPGPGLPKEYPILNEILSTYASYKSILGICLGQQAIANFYGCKLYNLTHPMHGEASVINHLSNCILYKDMPVSFKIGHYHSWALSNQDFPEDLEITSLNDNGLIMSIKHKRYDIRAVQFHPESILTEYGFKLIKNWLFN